MITKLSAPSVGTQAAADMVKQSVSATRSWQVALREAAFSPMLFMVQWNEPLTAATEQTLQSTRDAHDRWLEQWEAQSHDLVDRTFYLMEQSASAPLQAVPSVKTASK